VAAPKESQEAQIPEKTPAVHQAQQAFLFSLHPLKPLVDNGFRLIDPEFL
jgi:hypothetical protein